MIETVDAASRAHAVAAFLNSIGIETTLVDKTQAGFLGRVEIHEGSIRYTPVAFAGDLLHEAGHLAVTPSRYRHLMSGDVSEGVRKMCEAVMALNLEPGEPLLRAVLEASEPEATAWSWAAGAHLELKPQEIHRSE